MGKPISYLNQLFENSCTSKEFKKNHKEILYYDCNPSSIFSRIVAIYEISFDEYVVSVPISVGVDDEVYFGKNLVNDKLTFSDSSMALIETLNEALCPGSKDSTRPS